MLFLKLIKTKKNLKCEPFVFVIEKNRIYLSSSLVFEHELCLNCVLFSWIMIIRVGYITLVGTFIL